MFWFLALLALLFTAGFTLKSLFIHQSFGTSAYDLGVFQQAMWLISQFDTPFNTVRGMHSYGDHFRVVDYLFVPLYRLYPGIHWAFLVQSASIGVGALLLYRIGRHFLPASRFLPAVMAVAFLLNPVVHNPLVWQYHPQVLATGIYLGWILLYLKERPVGFFLLFLLLLGIREDICVTTAAFGIVAILQKRFRYGIPVLLVSVAWWLLVTRVLMPELNGGSGYFRLEQGTLQAWFGNLWNPGFYRQRLLQDAAVHSYWLFLFAPLLGLSLLSPLYLLPAIPTILVNSLVGGYNVQIGYHYSVNAVPFLYLAAIHTLVRWRVPVGIRNAIGIVLLLVTFTSAQLGSGIRNMSFRTDWQIWQDATVLRDRIASLKQSLIGDQGVSASDFLLPHFAERTGIYLFPNPWIKHYWGIAGENPHHPNRVNFIVVSPDQAAKYADLLSYLTKDRYFRLAGQYDRMLVFQRVNREPLDRAEIEARMQYYRGSGDWRFTAVRVLGPVDTAGEPGSRIPPAGTDGSNGLIAPGEVGRRLYIDLGALLGEHDNVSADIHAQLEVPKAARAKFWLGADDGVQVWLNGELILDDRTWKAYSPRQHKIDVQLKAGVNRWIFRVNNGPGAWKFSIETATSWEQ